ncbi:MAG: cysteine desulfurase family protein [Candidatus Micrarchaeota archaeon]
MKTIYLDNAATTRICKEAAKAVEKCQTEYYGNASSIHHKGVEARGEIEKARKVIAGAINAKEGEGEIIFTSGGTEANNLAIKGIAFSNPDKKHIITTKIEHDCVLNACKWLEGQGFSVDYLDVNGEGFVNLNELEQKIREDTILVSIIHANNEVGTIQNLSGIYDICKRKNVYFHTDGCQSFTKAKLDASMADLITLNSHKIHGPKGVGALYVKKGVKIIPLLHGGGHEKNMRSGTENVPGICGFAKAAEIGMNEKYVREMAELRDWFIEKLLEIEGTKLNGPRGEKRICNNINISFKGVEGESIVAELDGEGICASTGSACASKSLDASHVIMAISKNNHERAHGSIRFSLSRENTKEEIEFAVKETKKAVERLREISPVAKK